MDNENGELPWVYEGRQKENQEHRDKKLERKNKKIAKASAAISEYREGVYKDYKEFFDRGPIKEQCVLMTLLPQIAEVRGASPLNKNVVMASSTSADSTTETLMQKLVVEPKFAGFYSLSPAKLSALVPKIKLFFEFNKIRKSPGAEPSAIKNPMTIEIPFRSNITDDVMDMNSGWGTSPRGNPVSVGQGGYSRGHVAADLIGEHQELLKNSDSRGYGAGLKSFEWDFHGKTLFTADKDIRAKLKLYFASFDEFVAHRILDADIINYTGTRDEDTIWFRYSDLAAYDGSILDNLSYTLKAEVGWSWTAELANHYKENLGFTEGELDAIKHSTQTMMLRKTTHTIDINDDGTVDVAIEYIASTIGVLSQSKYSNILLSPSLMAMEIENTELRNNLVENCPDSKERKAALKAIDETYQSRRGSYIKQALNTIVGLLDGVPVSKKGGVITELFLGIHTSESMAARVNPYSARGSKGESAWSASAPIRSILLTIPAMREIVAHGGITKDDGWLYEILDDSSYNTIIPADPRLELDIADRVRLDIEQGAEEELADQKAMEAEKEAARNDELYEMHREGGGLDPDRGPLRETMANVGLAARVLRPRSPRRYPGRQNHAGA